jgi:hypothetical protein
MLLLALLLLLLIVHLNPIAQLGTLLMNLLNNMATRL